MGIIYKNLTPINNPEITRGGSSGGGRGLNEEQSVTGKNITKQGVNMIDSEMADKLQVKRLLTAIKRHCLDCSGDDAEAVTECPMRKSCDLYKYREGK